MLVVAIMLVFIVEVMLPGNLSNLGIRPRTPLGLPGVVLSPFLHADLFHLLANALPLLVMGCFVSALAPSLFVFRTVMLILISGSLTWLISSAGIVIGASGLVFAYWSYLIANGFWNKRVKDVFIALITIVIYGVLIFSLFRFQYGVSWAGHFSGVLAGIALAFFNRNKRRR